MNRIVIDWTCAPVCSINDWTPLVPVVYVCVNRCGVGYITPCPRFGEITGWGSQWHHIKIAAGRVDRTTRASPVVLVVVLWGLQLYGNWEGGSRVICNWCGHSDFMICFFCRLRSGLWSTIPFSDCVKQGFTWSIVTLSMLPLINQIVKYLSDLGITSKGPS